MASNGHHLNHLNQFPPPPSIPAILEGSRGIQPDGAGLDGSQGPAPPPPLLLWGGNVDRAVATLMLIDEVTSAALPFRLPESNQGARR